MPFAKHDTDRGPLFEANNGRVHFPQGNDLFEPALSAFAEFTGKAVEIEAYAKPEAVTEHVARVAGPMLSASNTVLAAAIADAKATAEADARALTPPPALAEAAKQSGPEIRASIRALPLGERIAKAATASAVELAALLEPGNLAELPDDALAHARDRARMLFHIERAGMTATHARKPSLERLLATGPDVRAVTAEAEMVLARHRARLDAVEANEAVLQNVVAYVAGALSIPPATALERIMAA